MDFKGVLDSAYIEFVIILIQAYIHLQSIIILQQVAAQVTTIR